jgi:DNA-binding NarL/FixJ family response regulator
MAKTLELCPQQKRIVELMLRDMCGKQMAAEMKLGMPTVRTYIKRIYERTGAANEKSLLLLICGMSHALRHPEK